MTYIFLAIATITLDNIIWTWILKEGFSLLLLIPLWFGVATIFGGIYLKFFNTYSQKNETRWIKHHPVQITLYFILSLLGIWAWGQAIIHSGIGSAVVIAKIDIILLSFFGIFILGETLNLRQWIITIVMILASIAFSYQGAPEFHMGVYYALVAMSCYTGQKMLMKTLSHKVDPFFLVTIRALIITLVFGLIFMLSSVPMDNSISWLYFILISIGGISGVFLNKIFSFFALKEVPISLYALFMQLKTVLMFIIAYFIFQENYTVLQIFAAGVMLIASMFLTQKKTVTPLISQ